MTSTVLGSTMQLIHLTESPGDDIVEKSFFSQLDKEDDSENSFLQHPRKKRCLTTNQVRFLERSFEVGHKVEPDRKRHLAKRIDLHPRQVATWFQNRRARDQTQQLEKDYGCLKASYDKLMSDYDNLFKENNKVKNEVHLLTEQLIATEKGRTKTQTFDSEKLTQVVKQTVNPNKLTYDLLVEIAKRLKRLEDFTCFRSVSKSLRGAVKEEFFEGLPLRQGTPYLMLPVREDCIDGDVRELYSLGEGESIVTCLEVPWLTNSTMCSESLGWLLAVQEDGSMCLLEPFTNTVIPVPHPDTIPVYYNYGTKAERMFIEKMVLSSRPNETADFILMAICGHCKHLDFWRSGDEFWNWIDTKLKGVRDVVYDGGEQFYAITHEGTIRAINLAAGYVKSRIIIHCKPVLRIFGGTQNQYIVKTIKGSLIAIIRTKEEKYFLTRLFHLYEIDTETGTWEPIYSLGSMSVFLGRNSSITVDASKLPTIKPNHIYFTDDFGEFRNIYFQEAEWRKYCRGSIEAKGGCVDSGVYNIQTGAIEPIYPVEPLFSNVCPAMWITPNLCL